MARRAEYYQDGDHRIVEIRLNVGDLHSPPAWPNLVTMAEKLGHVRARFIFLSNISTFTPASSDGYFLPETLRHVDVGVWDGIALSLGHLLLEYGKHTIESSFDIRHREFCIQFIGSYKLDIEEVSRLNRKFESLHPSVSADADIEEVKLPRSLQFRKTLRT